MSPPGRPKGEFRSAQHEGAPVSASASPRRAGRWWRSIKGRVLVLFVLLALGTTAVFLLGTQRLLATGWQAVVRPMVSDYADRLAAEIGSPPDAARARALAARLPIAVQIEGPRFSSTPATRRTRGATAASRTTPTAPTTT